MPSFSLSMSPARKDTTIVRSLASFLRIRPSRHFLLLTPLPLPHYNLQTPSAADIKIDIETVEKLIGEIIAQPLR
jgi:hypothetical protein